MSFLKSSQGIAVIVGVLAFIWVLSGFLVTPEPETPGKSAENAPAENKILEVRISDMKAVPFNYAIQVTGRSRAERSVELRAETSGRVEEILAEKGQIVKAGDILARLEIRDRKARADEARQRVSQREIEYNAAQSLENKGFNSRIKLAETRANLETARAELKQASIDLEKREIKAPFDGIINDRPAEIGDYLAIGEPLFQIVDLDPLKISAFIAERDIQDIKIGAKAAAEFLNGEKREGQVSFIAAAAQSEARTFEIEVATPNTDFALKEGFTATLNIPVAQRMAHKIPPSIISLDDAGRIGVKIVDQRNIARFMPVRILSDASTHMWIDGLPEQARIITVGQEFAADGQVVHPVASVPEPEKSE